MRCSTCGSDNAAERKFCLECGAPLALACPQCRTPNEARAKFCGECGTPLAATASGTAQPAVVEAPTAERRLVSVLFADLVGFTALSESRDPEAVRELLDS